MSSSQGVDRQRGNEDIEELVVQLEENLGFTTMEQGIKLVGAVINDKPLNKWGVKYPEINLERDGRGANYMG